MTTLQESIKQVLEGKTLKNEVFGYQVDDLAVDLLSNNVINSNEFFNICFNTLQKVTGLKLSRSEANSEKMSVHFVSNKIDFGYTTFNIYKTNNRRNVIILGVKSGIFTTNDKGWVQKFYDELYKNLNK